jgi:hypothetical protein
MSNMYLSLKHDCCHHTQLIKYLVVAHQKRLMIMIFKEVGHDGL